MWIWCIRKRLRVNGCSTCNNTKIRIITCNFWRGQYSTHQLSSVSLFLRIHVKAGKRRCQYSVFLVLRVKPCYVLVCTCYSEGRVANDEASVFVKAIFVLLTKQTLWFLSRAQMFVGKMPKPVPLIALQQAWLWTRFVGDNSCSILGSSNPPSGRNMTNTF